MVDTDGVWISCPLINHLAVHCLGWGKDDFYLYSLSGDGKCEILAGIIWCEAFGFFKLLGSMRRWWLQHALYSITCLCVCFHHSHSGGYMNDCLRALPWVLILCRGEKTSWRRKILLSPGRVKWLKWMQVCLYMCIVCVFTLTFSERVNQAFCDWLNVYT